MAAQARRWRSSKVTEAAAIPAKDLSRFLDRDIIPRDAADIDPGGSGRPRLFGARTVYRTAITYRLVRSGMAPATARRLASKFCDESQPGRLPGALFPNGRTLLIATPDGWDRCCEARELLSEHGLTFLDRYGSPRARPSAAIESQSRIAFARLCRELDLDVDPPVQGKRPPALRSNRRD
jgi:hypothetical protein